MLKYNKLYLFAVFLVMYEFTVYASNDMIMPGMLNVVGEFNASLSYIGLSLSYYLLGGALIQLALGPLAERYGQRLVILIGNALFIIATFSVVLSHSIHQFLLLRIVQGMGLAFIAVGYSLIHQSFNDKDALKLTTLMGNVSILAPLVGPMIGSLIISHFNWRYTYILTGLIALISMYGLYLTTPVAQVTSAISPRMIINNYAKVISNKKFCIGTIAIALLVLPSLGWIALAPTMLINNLKLGYLHYTLYQLVAIGGYSLCGFLMQFVSGRVAITRLIRFGNTNCIAGLVIFVLCLFVPNSMLQLKILCVAFLIYGFGCGICNSIIMRLIVSDKSYLTNFAMPLMVFIINLFLVLGVGLVNKFCAMFNFTVSSFVVVCLVIGIAASLLTHLVIRAQQNRKWQ